MSITRLANLLMKGAVALSLAFLCWLYVRSRHHDPIDSELIPVRVSVAADEQGSSTATVTFRSGPLPPQRTYELTDLPIQFLCPPGFPWKPTFATPQAGKASVRVIGPAADDQPQVQVYVDLTQETFEPGRNREQLKLLLPRDFQAAGDGAQLVTFTLEPQ